MNYELEALEEARKEGAIIVSNDSRFPNVTIYGGANLVECRGMHDVSAEVRNGVGWKPNSFEMIREVNKDGVVEDWKFIMLPQLTPETEETLDDLIGSMRRIPGGRGRIEVYREIGMKLPRIIMEKGVDGVKVVAPKVARLKISDNQVEFREKTGGFDEFVEGQGMKEVQYLSFELPLEVDSFLPKEIEDRNKYFIKSRVKLLQGSQKVLKDKIQGVIQNGSYTEGRLRALANISFLIGESYSEEAFV